jgi:hypothetical protein
LCQLHLNSATDAPLNVTFVRAPSNALLKVDVPIVFRGEDVSPGLRKGKPTWFIFIEYHGVTEFECSFCHKYDFFFLDLSSTFMNHIFSENILCICRV